MRLEKRDKYFAKALRIPYSDAFSSGLRNIAEVYVSMHPNPPEEWKHCLLDLKERELARLKKQFSVDKTSQTIIEDYLKLFYEESQIEEKQTHPRKIRVHNNVDNRKEIILEDQFDPVFHEFLGYVKGDES